MKFGLYKEAADYWLYKAANDHKGYAVHVSGTTTIDAFLNAAKDAGYNSATKNGASEIAKIYCTSIIPYAGAVDFTHAKTNCDQSIASCFLMWIFSFVR
jgi:hypothetical protein